jgi:uncharacterized membrane protein YphA (DoxX/SURF4 family)
MQNPVYVFQIALALGLLNVWLVRFNRETAYRGGKARTMREEFEAYGLPGWSTYLVGGLKIGAAIALIAGLWIPSLVMPAAALIVTLMLGALLMHAKIRDPLMKSLPAALMLMMSVSVVYLTRG